MQGVINTSRSPLLRAVTAMFVVLVITVPAWLLAGPVTLPHTLRNGDIADANQVNANFAALAVGVNDNAARIAALAGGTPTAALKPRVASGSGMGECPGCSPTSTCSNPFFFCEAKSCSSDADCGADGLCVDRSCASVLVSYRGAGYLLSIAAFEYAAPHDSQPQYGGAAIAIDDDTPQVVTLSHWPRLQYLSADRRNTFFEMPLGTGLRFSRALRIYSTPQRGPFGLKVTGNLTVTYAVE